MGFFVYVIAEFQQNYSGSISPFEEAAKYGFAVLVLFIVLVLLYKDWRNEKDYSKEEIKQLNGVIHEMADQNRKALERSTQAMIKQSDSNEAIINLIKDVHVELRKYR